MAKQTSPKDTQNSIINQYIYSNTVIERQKGNAQFGFQMQEIFR